LKNIREVNGMSRSFLILKSIAIMNSLIGASPPFLICAHQVSILVTAIQTFEAHYCSFMPSWMEFS
jgi:hypothetical protein